MTAVDRIRQAALRKRAPSIAVWNMPIIFPDEKKVRARCCSLMPCVVCVRGGGGTTCVYVVSIDVVGCAL